MSKYTPAENLVSMAMEAVGISDTRDEIVFKSWVYHAEKLMGSYRTLRDVCVIQNEGNKIKKPCDYVSSIDIRFATPAGAILGYTYSDQGNFKSVKQGEEASLTISIYEDEHFFHLGSNGSQVKHAELHYYKLPLDDKNEPLIPESHEFAIILFCEYMYYNREKRTNPSFRFNASDAYRKWEVEKARVKGNEKMPSPMVAREIASRWMSLLPSPIRKRI